MSTIKTYNVQHPTSVTVNLETDNSGSVRVSNNVTVNGALQVSNGSAATARIKSTSSKTSFQYNNGSSWNDGFIMDASGNVAFGSTDTSSKFRVAGPAVFTNTVSITSSFTLNNMTSTDGNLAIKLSGGRHVFSAYGYDFRLDNGILTPITYDGRLQYYNGASNAWVVPTGVQYIFAKLWGAGGGGGSYGGWAHGGRGGAGGFSHGLIPVVPGQTITIRPGGAGKAHAGLHFGWPDGGATQTTVNDDRYCGSGGGSSSIIVPSIASTPCLYAGGGGGSGASTGFAGMPGGAGGGLIGQAGMMGDTAAANWGYSGIGLYGGTGGMIPQGKGGTQTAGGAGGTGTTTVSQAGAKDKGGTHQWAGPYGGGGGGGYYGGGSGNYFTHPYSGVASMGGGGGGSGYVHSSIIMGQTYTGMGNIPPFFEDSDLTVNGTAAFSYGGAEGSDGGNGLVVIYYYYNPNGGGAP